MSIQSIRVRLTAWYTTVLALALIMMALGTYSLVSRVIVQRAETSLIEVGSTIMAAAGQETDRLVETVRRFRAPDRRVLLMTRDGQVLAESAPIQFREFIDQRVFGIQPTDTALLAAVQAEANRPPPRGRRERAEVALGARRSGAEGAPPGDRPGAESQPQARRSGAPGPRLRGRIIADSESPVRVVVRPLRRGLPQDLMLVVLGSARDQQFILHNVRNSLAIVTLIALVLAALPGYFLARRSLAPVSAMSRRAQRISAQNLDDRLPVANPQDELGQLSRVLNDLLNRLQGAFEQQRRFMAEAAHELRTPVSIVRGEAELALSRSERSSAEYRDALGIVESESKRMSRIVDDLLTLSRVAAGEYPLRRMPIDLHDIIERTTRALRVKAEQRNVSIELRVGDLPSIDGDPDLLQRMLTNLADNAIRHARPGTTVLLEGTLQNGSIVIRVTDHGTGIEPDAQARVFEPFFRGEAARADGEESGAGLGLPITLWIAREHGGDAWLVRSDPGGSMFEVVLPPVFESQRQPDS